MSITVMDNQFDVIVALGIGNSLAVFVGVLKKTPVNSGCNSGGRANRAEFCFDQQPRLEHGRLGTSVRSAI